MGGAVTCCMDIAVIVTFLEGGIKHRFTKKNNSQ